jgi:predicted transcriptional regulator
MPSKQAADTRTNYGAIVRHAAKIEALLAAGATQREVARIYGVSQPAVCELIRSRRTGSWLRTYKETTEAPSKQAAVVSGNTNSVTPVLSSARAGNGDGAHS